MFAMMLDITDGTLKLFAQDAQLMRNFGLPRLLNSPPVGGLSVLLCMMLLMSGCPKAPSDVGSEEGSKTDEETVIRLEHFDAPPLEELNASVEWEDQPVLDITAEMRQQKAAEPKLATAAEALQLKNDSDENNTTILSALGVPWESASDMNNDAEIKRLMPSDIKSTNPVMQSSLYETWYNSLTGLGFFSFDKEMAPFAPSELVVSWQTSKDKLYDKIVIRDDLVWSDGKPVTAHDVAFSFQLIMNPDVPIPAVRTGMDSMKWIEAYDDHTVVYFHKESLATNVWNLNFPILPKHIYEESVKEDPTLGDSEYHLKFEQNPVVGGPYKLVKRIKNQEVVVERREDWYMHKGQQVRPKPNFKTVRFRVIEDSNTALLALKNGDIEDMEFQPEQWVEQTSGSDYYDKNTKARGEQWVYYYFGWNCKTPLFEDTQVRKAMSYAVDYDHILKTLCYGLYTPCTSEFHENSWAGPKVPRQPYQQDLAKAEELLEDAGWVDDDGDGIREKEINGKTVKFEFTIMCANDQLRIDICTSLKEALGRIGVSCNVKPTEFTVMQENARAHQFQAMFGGWGTGADPFSTANLWKTGENRNYGLYSNSKVDELFDKALQSLVQDERATYYREIDDILWDEQPYTWLYYRSAFYGFNKNLRGYTFSPRGPYSYSPGFDAIWAVK